MWRAAWPPSSRAWRGTAATSWARFCSRARGRASTASSRASSPEHAEFQSRTQELSKLLTLSELLGHQLAHGEDGLGDLLEPVAARDALHCSSGEGAIVARFHQQSVGQLGDQALGGVVRA